MCPHERGHGHRYHRPDVHPMYSSDILQLQIRAGCRFLLLIVWREFTLALFLLSFKAPLQLVVL